MKPRKDPHVNPKQDLERIDLNWLRDVDEEEEPARKTWRGNAVWIGPLHVLRRTEKATLYKNQDGREDWLPNSQIIASKGDLIRIPEWLAKKSFLKEPPR